MTAFDPRWNMSQPWWTIKSSLIHSFKWFPALHGNEEIEGYEMGLSGHLYIRFKNNDQRYFHYKNVTNQDGFDFVVAPSKGQYFHRKIRNEYDRNSGDLDMSESGLNKEQPL
jgi:hypothetical protein